MKKRFKIIFSLFSILILCLITSCNIEFVSFINDDSSVNTSSTVSDDEYTDENKTEEENTNESDENKTITIADYALDYKELYAYQQLSKDRYSSVFIDVYETLYNDAYNFLISDKDYSTYNEDGVNLTIISEYKFTNYNQLNLIVSAWINMIEENPLFYFTYTGYKVNSSKSGSNTTYSFCFLAGGDYALAKDRAKYNNEIMEMIDEFYTEYDLLEEKDDFAKAKLIHDFIASKVSYAYNEDGTASTDFYAHNIIGVVEKKGSVCESYAETFLLLSHLVDLDSLIVLGYSGNTGHAWNYVSVDGIWYGLDLTWDDAYETLNYNYFLVSNAIMAKAHTPNNSSKYGMDYGVSLPTLSNTSYDTSLDENTTVLPFPFPFPPFPGRRR